MSAKRAAKRDRPCALVLCGGAGTRMAPWSDQRHKCLVQVDDGWPLFARHVTQLYRHGFCVHANVPTPWVDAFRDVARGLKVPVDVVPESGKPHGSGTTLLRLARESACARRARYVATVCGDAWYSDEYYRDIADERIDGGVRVYVTDPDLTDGGAPGMIRVVNHDGSLRVSAVHEGRRAASVWRAGDFQAAGVTAWSRGALDVFARKFGRRGGVDMMGDVLPYALVRGADVRAWTVRDGQVRDLGTPARYARFVLDQYAKKPVNQSSVDGALALLTARRVFTAGNGGACAVAEHACIDWARAGRRDVTALTDPVTLTAWANDHGYAGALARQVERVRDPQDCALVLFSASGSSPNVVEAAKRAREVGFGAVVSVSHADSTAPLHAASTTRVLLPFGTPRGLRAYGRIEDAMQAWAHAVACVMAGLSPWKSCEAEGAR